VTPAKETFGHPRASRFAMIDSSAGNRNPVPPIIHVIDEALGRLLYFPNGYPRGLLHSSEISPGDPLWVIYCRVN
jgi:hypothetical protein